MKNPMEGFARAMQLIAKITKAPQMAECKTPLDCGQALAHVKKLAGCEGAETLFLKMEIEGKPVVIVATGGAGAITAVKSILG